MNRRTILQALAAAPLAGQTTAGMYLALNNSLTGAQPGSGNGPARIMDYDAFLRLAAKVGYAGADVTLGNAMKLDAVAVRKLYKDLRLKPGLASQLPPLFSKDAAGFQESLKKLEHCIGFMSAIGCDTAYAVIPASSDVPKSELRKIYLERLELVSELLWPLKIRLGLKFVGLLTARRRQQHEFIWRMDETLAFAKECGPNIGIMLDSWHWHLAGAKPADIVAAGRDRIVSVHVADARQQPPAEVKDDHRVLPGEGVMDLVGFFTALRKIGYTGAVGPEPLGRFTRPQWDGEGAKQALEATRAVMRRAGINV